jgi:hypothetical protein
MRAKAVFVETEDGRFISNDASTEAKRARAHQRKLAKQAKQERLEEAIELLFVSPLTTRSS